MQWRLQLSVVFFKWTIIIQWYLCFCGCWLVSWLPVDDHHVDGCFPFFYIHFQSFLHWASGEWGTCLMKQICEVLLCRTNLDIFEIISVVSISIFESICFDYVTSHNVKGHNFILEWIDYSTFTFYKWVFYSQAMVNNLEMILKFENKTGPAIQ